MKFSSSPWSALPQPEHQALRAKRVDAKFPWDFFWAVDMDGNPLLVLQYQPAATLPANDLPLLEGIQIERVESPEDHKLLFRLLDSSHIDIFHRLCLDIISGTTTAATEMDAVRLAIARTWRWHHLLRGGSNTRLTENQQKGLIGELLVLDNYLLSAFDPITAVSCWTGPRGTPKDFEAGEVCIEVKARRGAATPYIRISSEDQLDDSLVGRLFLHVVNLSASVQSGHDDCSVTDVASKVHQRIGKSFDAAADAFEERLSAAGFRWEDDYSDSRWLVGGHSFYEVRGQFPRITAHAAGAGVSDVKYSVSLEACEEFRVDDSVVLATLKGV